ncbi:MAG: FecR domain-containing protein [Tannerellaceae bacterium]|jgi:ferric-dicitrate binding protein FerR (iron transport regulator)|nr:FecR domain-containing protein [Tannerellaceae bacterium]
MMVDRDLLTRYFLGECSEVEKEAIRAWLEADASHGREFARERIRFDATLLIDEGRLPSYRAAWGWRRVGMVAAVALACVLPWLVHELLRPSAVMQEVYAPPGNRAQVLLPDGSQAWLYGNSRLRYPSVFVGGDRRVELDGEAWFEVSASAGRRFVLSAGGYEIEALGTAFNVDAYSSGGAFSAALFEGSVRLHRAGDAGRELYLRPGQKAERVGDSLLVFPANINAYRMREGIIVIEDKPFEEIMEIFEKYYGLEIVVRNERLRGLGYRGKFRMSDGVEHALNVLRKDFRFAYSRPDSVNIIYIY